MPTRVIVRSQRMPAARLVEMTLSKYLYKPSLHAPSKGRCGCGFLDSACMMLEFIWKNCQEGRSTCQNSMILRRSWRCHRACCLIQVWWTTAAISAREFPRSEERRVGKE